MTVTHQEASWVADQHQGSDSGADLKLRRSEIIVLLKGDAEISRRVSLCLRARIYAGESYKMKDMPSKVADAMYSQCQARGFCAPADVLMDIGVLDRARYDDWRAGRVPFLEAVCIVNLHKLSEIMREIRDNAARSGLKPSISSYRHKGKTLQFSKTGNPKIEKAYATHYVMEKKT